MPMYDTPVHVCLKKHFVSAPFASPFATCHVVRLSIGGGLGGSFLEKNKKKKFDTTTS